MLKKIWCSKINILLSVCLLLVFLLLQVELIQGQVGDEPSLEIVNILKEINKLTSEKKWQQSIQLWDSVQIKYRDEYIPFSPCGRGRYVALYNQASIYGTYLNKLDSAFSKFATLLQEYPDEIVGGYEHRNPGDISVAVHFSKLLNKNTISDNKRILYLSQLRGESKTANVKAVLDIEIANVHFQLGEIEEAEKLLKSIINGPKLPWGFFKYSGDFRWSAISSWAYLGQKYVSREYVCDRFYMMQSRVEDAHLLWIIKYSLAEIYYRMDLINNAKEYFIWCRSNCELANSDYPFSFSRRSDMLEPYVFTMRVDEVLGELE